jgi:hypothetical protein
MRNISISIIFCLLTIVLCNAKHYPETSINSMSSQNQGKSLLVQNRDSIRVLLKKKIQHKTPLIVHVFVPLCDNENQGIVPVNKKLGDGMNLQTNLYWGAGYGFRSFFKLKTDWKLKSKDSLKDPILERVCFTKTMSNGTKIVMVGDAYRGDRMKQSLHHYFASLAGERHDSISVDRKTLQIASNADLLIFNGHDGLMDDTVKIYKNVDGKPRDAMMIACYSGRFFQKHLEHCGGYPLITTTGLLAPEAYVMHAAIEAWAQQKSDSEIRNAAGDAYWVKHPKSGQAGSRGLFRTGWWE